MAKTTTPITASKPQDGRTLANPKYKKLAEERLGKALKAISLIGNMAAYKPTDLQRKAMIDLLGNAVAGVAERLKTVTPSTGPTVNLPS